MTTIPAVSTNTVAVPTNDNTAALSSDFDTFLKMLTTQIQNQDPLNPMDSSDYAVQLATFSGVEQQVQTNDLLRDLSGAGLSGISAFAGWVGMEVLATGPVHFDGNPVTLQFDHIFAQGDAELVVSTPAGQELHRRNITNVDSPMEWDGKAPSGVPLLAGNYSLAIEYINANGETAQMPVSSFARVIELREGNQGPELVLDHGNIVGVSLVSALRETDSGSV